MSEMKSSPRAQAVHYEKELVNEVRLHIKQWPKVLQYLFEEIQGEVKVDNELLKMFEVLVQLKRELDEGYEEFQDYKIDIEQCYCHLYKGAPYLEEKFNTVLRNHDQHQLPKIYEEIIKPEAADIPSSDVPKTSRNIPMIYILLCLLIGIIAYSCALFCTSDNKTPDNTNIEPNKIAEWTQNIQDLKLKFPSQNEKVWSNILSGVKTIVTEKPTKPSVLLLLHNDKKTSACLANKVGKEAVKLLSDSTQEPIIIQGEDLKFNESLKNDYGLFTESYKHDIEEKHVMIVFDLQEVPGTVAQTFHALCDVENPLVRNAAFLFTMQVDEKRKQKPTKIAEDYLSQLWKNSLPGDIMDPLITRITDAVVSVKMESHLPC